MYDQKEYYEGGPVPQSPLLEMAEEAASEHPYDHDLRAALHKLRAEEGRRQRRSAGATIIDQQNIESAMGEDEFPDDRGAVRSHKTR